RPGRDFYSDNFISNSYGDRPGHVYSREVGAGDGPTQRWKSEIHDLSAAGRFDCHHSNLLRRLEYRKEFSVADAGCALATLYCSIAVVRSHGLKELSRFLFGI